MSESGLQGGRNFPKRRASVSPYDKVANGAAANVSFAAVFVSVTARRGARNRPHLVTRPQSRRGCRRRPCDGSYRLDEVSDSPSIPLDCRLSRFRGCWSDERGPVIKSHAELFNTETLAGGTWCRKTISAANDRGASVEPACTQSAPPLRPGGRDAAARAGCRSAPGGDLAVVRHDLARAAQPALAPLPSLVVAIHVA